MKVVLPAAGLGTRLLPSTKEQPKEMLPIFSKGKDNQLCVKPTLQMVYEQLFDSGFREFCIVVGRGKRTIEDHFTPDRSYVELLHEKGKDELARELESFYEKIDKSKIFWVNQPEAKGFGDAVLRAKSFADDDRILVHAGDTYVASENNEHLNRITQAHENFDSKATLTLLKVENPKKYGVAKVEEEPEDEVYTIKDAVEKPEKPPTNLAVMPIYVFEPSIFEALEKTPPGKGNELQLTDGFVKLIEWGEKVRGIKLKSKEARWDIGKSQTYWEALGESYRYAQKQMKPEEE